MRFSMISLATLMLAAAAPAYAQDETSPPDSITISGGASVVSDYRFRGFSQSNEEPTIQGTITISHESGFYVGTWGSGIGFAGGTEIDLYGGFSHELTPGLTADIGATVYLYPNGTGPTTIVEPYLSLSGDLGPVSAKAGVAWAPSGQDSLSNESSVYLYTDMSTSIPTTPITLKAHLGYANSDSFLGGLDGDVIDYSLGAEVSWKALTLGVAYVDTNETGAGNWNKTIQADSAVVVSLSAAF